MQRAAKTRKKKDAKEVFNVSENSTENDIEVSNENLVSNPIDTSQERIQKVLVGGCISKFG